MIGWLKGFIRDKTVPGKFIIDVSGVGYDVETSLTTFFELELHTEPVILHIHTVVREDALLLYGFAKEEERQLFRSLIKVNGVGPKLAISILSSISPQEFIQRIHQQDAAFLTKLPGIGKKTAERLVVEMKDRLEPIAAANEQLSLTRNDQSEAISALVALGYKEPEANRVIKKLDDGHKNCEQLIRQALQQLALA